VAEPGEGGDQFAEEDEDPFKVLHDILVS